MKVAAGYERGFFLVVVMIFLAVLTVAAFGAALAARTDVQVVRNIEQSRQALAIAEAGVSEAWARLVMPTGTEGEFDGHRFDPSIRPQAYVPAWTGYISFSTLVPVQSGAVLLAPTLQSISQPRLAYSTDVLDPNRPPEDALKMSWELCTERALPACSGVGQIRRVQGIRVLNVASTGVVGDAARRRLTQQLLVAAGTSAVFLDPGCPESNPGCTSACPAVDLQGGADVTFPLGVTINSNCTNGPAALNLSNNTTVTAGDAIDIVGTYVAPTGTLNPIPRTGRAPLKDPLRNVPPPDFATLPCTSQSGPALRPGRYCGGIQRNSTGTTVFLSDAAGSDYIIDGGSFSVSGDAQLTTAKTGVTFYITNGAHVDLGPNGGVNLVAQNDGPRRGILIFQDRANTNRVRIGGGFDSGLNGLIYAQNADIEFYGNNRKTLTIELVVAGGHFQPDVTVTGPSATPLLGSVKYDVEALAWRDR